MVRSPEETPLADRRRSDSLCLIVLAVCAAGAVLTALRPVITPLLVGGFLFLLVNPFVQYCHVRRIPAWLAYLLVSVAVVVAVFGIGWVMELNGRALVERLPQYERRAAAALDHYARLAGLANADGRFDWDNYGLRDLMPVSQEELIAHAFGSTLEMLEVSTLAVFYLLFLLMEARRLPERARRSLEPESAARVLTIVDSINADIWRYLVVKTAVSAGLGVTTAVLGLLFGLDFWLLWGFLMFLANYVTYVGSILALGPPILIAFVQFDRWPAAAMLAALLILARFAWIDYVELRYSGKHVNVSPLLLLFGLAVLGWMWGVVGMLLAVPLITSIRIALSSHPESAYLARLMSDVE